MPNKKLAASIVGLSLLVGAGAGAYAGANLQEIKAYLNADLKVRVNGSVVQLNDQQGSAILPITYEGNTYLPVRAVANALQVAVDYDAANQEVILGEKVNGTPLNAEKFNDYTYTKDPTQTTYKNKDYKEAYYYHDGSGGPTLIITPDKKYQTLHLKIAALDKDLTDIKIKDLDSNALLKDVGTISPNDGLKDIEVNIGNVKTVTISLQVKDGGGYFVPLIDSYYK
ncbi:stalk domain-containing protein [Paenibacillus hamazuiensis]|uniref:stalk domain-containing protein n=1 Tax=Paenibacillus hamazuiensis TaxID=2936508 RepID=UPI00200DBF00|nr:stalk domain-containing protein [Paenibacillus hamazuiensis]